MKREQVIESLIHQFTENIRSLPNEVLKQVESGKLVISLTPSVEHEAGGMRSIKQAKAPLTHVNFDAVKKTSPNRY